jgi:rod shape determining protein RodA
VKTHVKTLDWTLMFLVFTLSTIGILMVYSATEGIRGLSHIWEKQAIWLLVAIGVTWLVSQIDYRLWLESAFYLYGLALVFLLLVLFLGDETKGAQRWLDFGILSFQPSELAKFAVILALARYIGSKGLELYYVGRFFFILGMIGVPLALILEQPDLGSAILLIPVSVVLMYAGGVRFRWLLWMGILGLASTPILWQVLREYQRRRITIFLNPQTDPLGAGYNIIQSIIAVGSGGISGKGFMQGTQTQLSFIPEHHTDFIFSVIGEEWGFAGGLAVLTLYFLLFRRAFEIAQKARDREGALLAMGIVTMYAIQTLINIGMAVGLLPVAGLTLPFISYGGSSLLYSWIEFGILLNISYSIRRPALLGFKG